MTTMKSDPQWTSGHGPHRHVLKHLLPPDDVPATIAGVPMQKQDEARTRPKDFRAILHTWATSSNRAAYRPAALTHQPVSRRVHDQWLWGFVAGCALTAGIAILAIFLLWPRG